jgi:hypothetical protein
MRRQARDDRSLGQEATMDVPVQYFQSVIALETAVTGVLLFQIRFFASSRHASQESQVDPRLRLLLLVVLAATHLWLARSHP